ncbi:MAG TPA: hypothetical protein VEB22_11005 [Phycisphaerales bacterium]|nr:hypothetical protein [Phycisphaerales bacterium]
MPRVDCGHCGYDLTSLVTVDPTVRCPECGCCADSVDSVAPWPCVAAVAWDLIRAQAAVLGVLVLIAGLIALEAAVELNGAAAGLLWGAFLFTAVVAFGMTLIWPVTHAWTVTRRHARGGVRVGWYLILLITGWTLGVAAAALAGGAIFRVVSLSARGID